MYDVQVPGEQERFSRCLLEHLASGSTLLIGELHGTKEIPAIVQRIIELAAVSNDVLLLAELPIEDKDVIDAFLNDESADSEGPLLSGATWGGVYYGKGSEAMLDLLRSVRDLRKRGMRVDVEPFDPRLGDTPVAGSSAEEALADCVLEKISSYPKSLKIVHCGNIHSATKAEMVGIDGRPLKPMGVFLKERLGKVVSLEIRARLGGSSWGVIQDDDGEFRSQPYEVFPCTLPYEVGAVTSLPYDAPWDLMLIIESVSPSPPAFSE